MNTVLEKTYRLSCTGCCFCDDEAGIISPASSSPLFSALLKGIGGSVQGRRQALPRLEKRGSY